MNSLDNFEDKEEEEGKEEGFAFSDNKTSYKAKINKVVLPQ